MGYGRFYWQHSVADLVGNSPYPVHQKKTDRRIINDILPDHKIITMLRPAVKRNILRVIPFGCIWLIAGFVYTLLEKGLLGDAAFYPSTGNPYNFSRNLFITPLAALIMGLLIGTLEILYLNMIFQQKTLGKKIVYKSVTYLFVILLFMVVTSVIANCIELGASPTDKEVWKNVGAFLTNYAFISVSVYMAFVIVALQFYAEVSQHIGLGVLANFFTGKYHTPKEEERIFMFLDMKSSTTIAELLGHVRYFEMLREYYADISAPIVAHQGEVYQYVGDEIVVSWKQSKGLKNNNCIRCFFAMKEALQKKAGYYQGRFGVTPSFKAGFHMGRVTAGEIGVIKKEIIFTGDVLNTAARIQSLCNKYNTDLLLSGELLSHLTAGAGFSFHSFGKQELRGRDEWVELFTVS